MIALIAEFAFKELCMLIFGYMTLRKTNRVNSSQWHGKLSTVLLYAVMMVLILFPRISMATANSLIAICALVMLMSFILYARFYQTVLVDCVKH